MKPVGATWVLMRQTYRTSANVRLLSCSRVRDRHANRSMRPSLGLIIATVVKLSTATLSDQQVLIVNTTCGI
jgi:hypothetical protein